MTGTPFEHVPHTPAVCWCRCHDEPDTGMVRGARRDNAVDAATACGKCLRLHADVFKNPPSPPPPPKPQADGYTDGYGDAA
jgi:hypothetical protein